MRSVLYLLTTTVIILAPITSFAQPTENYFPDFPFLNGYSPAGRTLAGALNPQLNSIPEEYRLIASVKKIWVEPITDWMATDSSAFTYNEANEQAMVINYGSENGVDWVPRSRLHYSYNADGQLTAFITDSWDGEQWSLSAFDLNVSLEYDDEGRLILEIVKVSLGGSYENNNRSSYIYDPLTGLLSTRVVQIWDGLAWVNNLRAIYEDYDDNDNVLLIVNHQWDNSSLTWEIYRRIVYEYDADGNRTLELYENADGAEWVGDYRYSYTFDSLGNRTSWIEQDWNAQSESWVNDDYYQYEYDEAGGVTFFIWQNWNYAMEAWENEFRAFYHNDEQGNPLIAESQNWIPETGTWENDEQGIFYYELFVDTKQNISDDPAAAEAYPNPSNDVIFFRLNGNYFDAGPVQLRVANSFGQIVQSHQCQAGQLQSLNLEGLPSGHYFLHFVQGQTVISKPISIARK